MDWLAHLQEAHNKNQSCALVTLIGLAGSAPREVGAKMLIFTDGRIQGTVGGGQFEHQIIREAQKHLTQISSPTAVFTQDYPLSVKTQQCCGGTVQVLFEIFPAQNSLYIFGAGHVGQALCEVMSGLSFHMHLVDEREEWIYSEKVPASIHKIHHRPMEFAKSREWKSSDSIVVLTHSHDLDFELVDFFCVQSIKFLGLIGSETKWTQMRKKLQNQNRTPEQIEKIRCPIGLKIGGKNPKEVAISIAGELIQDFYKGDSHAQDAHDTPVRW